MEPIGTITMHFPFIDEETKNILTQIMKEASDYYNFVVRLGNLVLKNDSPIMVVYFAIHHAILALEYSVIDEIREKYGDHNILKPNLFMSSAYQGSFEDIERVHEIADEILDSNPEDWIALEMNFIKFEASMRNYPKTIYKSSTMDRISELLDSDKNLGFYETILFDYLAIRAHHDGDTKGRLDCLNKGLQIAEKFDDQLRVAHLLIRKSGIFKGQEARELLERAYDIVDSSLGIPANFADIIYWLSVLDIIKGDFDRAIKLLLQSVSIRERASLNSGNASLLVSILYNVIAEPESGLEWAQMAEDQFRSRPYMINRSVLSQIWALALLKKMTEAELLLDTTRESVIKSGDEMQLGWLHFVTGVFEIERCDYSLAASSIEQALSIYENYEWKAAYESIFLYYLAKTEIYSTGIEGGLCPTLMILEESAISENRPGLHGQVLLLKAELALLQSDDSQLREVIKQLQELIETENLPFLKPQYESLLSKI